MAVEDVEVAGREERGLNEALEKGVEDGEALEKGVEDGEALENGDEVEGGDTGGEKEGRAGGR